MIPPNHYVEKFDVRTWGVDILKVCRVPPGWTITAGGFGDPEGQMSGQGNIGVAFITTPASLAQMFLVRVHEYQRVERKTLVGPHGSYSTHPASFSGKLGMGTYGDSYDIQEKVLAPEDFVRIPAANCP